MGKLVFVTPWYSGFAGGAEATLRELAEALVKRNFDIEVFTTCCQSPYEDWATDHYEPGVYQQNGVSVKRFAVNKKGLDNHQRVAIKRLSQLPIERQEMYDFFTYGINSDSLIHQVTTLEPSIPVIACPYFQSLIFSLVTKIPKRISVIPAFHNEPEFYWHPVFDLIQQAKQLLFLTQEEKSLAIKAYGSTIGRRLVESQVIGIGMEIPRQVHHKIQDTQFLQTVRQKHQIPETFFLYVGRKEPAKGIDTLVKWYQDYLAYRNDRGLDAIPLVFIGGGHGHLVPQTAHFIDLGVVDAEDKFALMTLARALINLSSNESFSRVIIESWLCGTPVLVSAQCPVTTGHCHRSNGGLAVSTSQEFQIALDVLNNPVVRASLAQSGKRYVQTYSWDNVLDAFLRAVYQA